MKNVFTLILLATITYQSSAQEFQFTMIFTDTMGNTDTLVMGYDASASEGVDDQFGEVNIISEPWDSVFEVRITSKLRPTDQEPIEDYEMERQIITIDCEENYPPTIEIDIKAIHWPITAVWDQNLFKDSCNEGSVFTSVPLGGWWDVGSPSDLWRVWLSETALVTFSDNVDDFDHSHINHNYAYLDSSGNVISAFWVGMGKENLGVSTRDQILYPDFTISPNPVGNETIFIRGVKPVQVKQVEVLDRMGKVLFQTNNLELDLF